MSTGPRTTPNPRRRWLQFSLRTLTIVMLLGVGANWSRSPGKGDTSRCIDCLAPSGLLRRNGYPTQGDGDDAHHSRRLALG
jgi:hypothetical protein